MDNEKTNTNEWRDLAKKATDHINYFHEMDPDDPAHSCLSKDIERIVEYRDALKSNTAPKNETTDGKEWRDLANKSVDQLAHILTIYSEYEDDE